MDHLGLHETDAFPPRSPGVESLLDPIEIRVPMIRFGFVSFVASRIERTFAVRQTPRNAERPPRIGRSVIITTLALPKTVCRLQRDRSIDGKPQRSIDPGHRTMDSAVDFLPLLRASLLGIFSVRLQPNIAQIFRLPEVECSKE